VETKRNFLCFDYFQLSVVDLIRLMLMPPFKYCRTIAITESPAGAYLKQGDKRADAQKIYLIVT
jgi:hypothetical protein